MTLIDSNKVFARIMQEMMDAMNLENESFMGFSYNFFAFQMLEGLPFKTVAGADMIVWSEINNEKIY